MKKKKQSKKNATPNPAQPAVTATRRKKPKKERLESFARGVIIAVFCCFFIGVGYTIMDIHLERRAMPIHPETEVTETADMTNVIITAKGVSCQPLSLDGSIMLNAVIENTFDEGYSALAFDIKRNDGTIGYESKLATISSYGAISSPSSALAESVKILKENDIMPIGIISCYKDNIVPNADLTSAIMAGGGLYTDSGSNTYLNPDLDSTYNYIKGIVDEAMGLGVEVFVLDNYNLPDDITDDYNDGFDAIADRLYADFGDSLKLLKAVDLYIGIDEEVDLDELWQSKSQGIDLSDSNTILCVSTNDPEALKPFLNQHSVESYIIIK